MARLLDGTRIYGTANVDTSIYIGNANVFINSLGMLLGNNSVNTFISPTSGFYTGNSTVNVSLSATGLFVGNSTVNTFLTSNSFKIPVGTTAERPANANTGNFRFNTDIASFEFATNSTNWSTLSSQINYTAANTVFANTLYANSSILVGNTAASSNVAKITVALPGTTTYSNITNTTITATGITSIQSTSNYSPFVSNNFIMAYGPSLNTYAVTLDSAKSVNLPSISLVTGDGFCFEFFAKLPTLNTSGVTITTDGINRLSAFVNTSIISINNYGYMNRGSASFTLAANTWYHFAYMGYGSETYFAVNGVVKGLGSLGGGSAYTVDGNWSQGWPGFTRDIVVSNLRITKNYLPYPLSGFTPPNYDLARLPHTHLLAFQTPHFVDVDGGYTITTSGAPEITRTNITSTGTRYYSRVGKINHNNITFGSDNSNVVITNTSIIISSGNSSVSTSNVVFSLTDLRVPVGNTGQRPTTNTNSGYLRFNTDINDLEYATNTSNWYAISNQPSITVANTITVGNSTVNTVISSNVIRTGIINVASIFAAGSYGTSGQVLASNGSTVYWSSAAGGGGGASVTISETAPFNPTNGNLWWNSNTGVMYIYFTELVAPFASQWVSTTPPGPLGYTGSKGDPTGYTGSQGFQGFTGFTGSVGLQGPVGIGYAGSLGYTGSIGGSGYIGSRGNTGYVGSKGETGYAGSIGSTGYTGSVGPQGDPGGYTGSQGITGFTGSAGGGGATVTISTTPPGGASPGNLWYNSDKGETYIYYDDGDSQQWVSVVGYMQPAQGYTGSTGAGYVGSAGLFVSNTAPANTGVMWFDTTANALAGYTGSAGTNGYTGSAGIGYTGSAGAGGGGGSNTAVVYTYNLIFGRG